MSGPKPWSDNPNAPQVPFSVYFAEKSYFTGFLLGAILYGVVIALFFRCMGTLLNPVHQARRGTEWGLLIHTTAMFSFVTVSTAATLGLQSISFINNRRFPGADGVLPPGPVGYQLFVYSKAIGIVPQVMYLLNTWLADGLLLYRCCIIYASNYWVITFPCLMYLATLITGIGLMRESSRPNSIATESAGVVRFGTSYLTISFSLNILLTLMIVTRLILHRRNNKAAMGSMDSVGGLYKAIVTIIVESYALYAVTFLLFIIPWAARSYTQYVFLQVLSQIQVIAPFLIILRLANRSALTGEAVVSEDVDSIHFRSQEWSMVGIVTTPDTYSIGPAETGEETPDEPGAKKTVGLCHHGRNSESTEVSLKVRT